MTEQVEINSESNNSSPQPENKPAGLAPKRPFRISRLMMKELRETLRDRRTIITLVLMPLLVYPALSLVFKTFLLNNLPGLAANDPIAIRIAYSGDLPKEELDEAVQRFGIHVNALQSAESLSATTSDSLQEKENGADAGNPFPGFKSIEGHLWTYIPNEPEGEMSELVATAQGSAADDKRLDVGMFITKTKAEAESKTLLGYQIKLIHRNDALSHTASDYLKYWIRRVNESEARERLKFAGLPFEPTWSTSVDIVGESTESSSPVPLASLVPLVLVLMTITGAVYPAIDLTAGERERGTLETLMAAPIPRFGILFSKFVAVVVVAMLTALLNLIGMFATIWAFQLDKQFGIGIFNLTTMFQILMLLVLFAAFFSAILLVVTSFARSFKEAQVYLIPIILLSLGPGLMAMAPGMELTGFNAVCPMVNILLLARDVINGSVDPTYAWIAVVSTLIYGVIALSLAARLFGSDAILNADANSLKDLILRPKRPQAITPIGAAMFCTLMLVPLNFVAIEWLNRFPSETSADFTNRFILLAISLAVIFVAFPALVAWYQRVDFRSGFGLTIPKPLFAIGGILLGLSLWPIVMWLTTVWHELYGVIAGAEARDAWNDQLVELTKQMAGRIQAVPSWVVLTCLAIAPAVCEEFFFRGMLQRSLLKNVKAWQAIAISAIVFGAFHTISSSVIAVDRFIPTTLVGLILGYVAYKSNSLLPGVLLHAIHNACVSFLAHFQETLVKQSWFPQNETIPWHWVAAGAVAAAIGLALIIAGKRPADQVEPVHRQV
jgi:membrane protease YdiL (CAAX protease family)/ABC-type transport system involved in multi-copper enzyme maturation permease subunit